MVKRVRRCELFCRVVDNFGDAGVCWRLAHQLAAGYGWQLRLHIDRPEALFPLIGRALPLPATVDGVGIEPWDESCRPAGEVVIEAFGCRMPDTALAHLAERPDKVVWINLEYLSTEPWAVGCHLQQSPHPRRPLSCTFLIPGFRPGTGGLLREDDLLDRRDAWRADAAAQGAFWQSLGGRPDPTRLLVSLFAYAGGATERALAAWAGQPTPATLVVNAELADRLALPEDSMGSLDIRRIPFLPQDAYDRLLWAADLNLVRGEDSLVRAFWAGRPFLWQPYRQAGNAHREKLAAFLDTYLGGVPAELAGTLRQAFVAWSDGDAGRLPSLAALAALRPAWTALAESRARRMAGEAHLAERLARYAETRLEC
jgi:uncharacterized repeat protein (TIGR03837 family)